MKNVERLLKKLVAGEYVEIAGMAFIRGFYYVLPDLNNKRCGCLFQSNPNRLGNLALHGTCHISRTGLFLSSADIEERLLDEERTLESLKSSLLLILADPEFFRQAPLQFEGRCAHFGLVRK